LLSSSIATNNNISLRCSVAPTHQRPKRIEKSRFGFDSIRFSLYSTRFDSTHFLKFLIRFDSIRLTLYSVRFDSIRLIHNEKSSFFVLCSTHCACLQKRFCLSPLRVGWVSVRQEFNTINHTHTRPQEYIWFDILPYTEKGLFYSALYIVRDLVIMCAISFEFGEAQND